MGVHERLFAMGPRFRLEIFPSPGEGLEPETIKSVGRRLIYSATGALLTVEIYL